jgi:hypothetical protein
VPIGRWIARAATRYPVAVRAFWWCGVTASALVIVNIDLLLPRVPRGALRIALGAVLLPAGLALAFDRDRIRPFLLSRFPGRARRIVVGAGLRLLGVAWIGAGAFDLLRGLRDLV